jgi:DNA-directed RNA polymerase subunit alpha
MMGQPVTDLNLSVRSRKCMTRLGITLIGELVNRTPDELLSAKNFGVTSLNEIRAKLAEVGIKLRND